MRRMAGRKQHSAEDIVRKLRRAAAFNELIARLDEEDDDCDG